MRSLGATQTPLLGGNNQYTPLALYNPSLWGISTVSRNNFPCCGSTWVHLRIMHRTPRGLHVPSLWVHMPTSLGYSVRPTSGTACPSTRGTMGPHLGSSTPIHLTLSNLWRYCQTNLPFLECKPHWRNIVVSRAKYQSQQLHPGFSCYKLFSMMKSWL